MIVKILKRFGSVLCSMVVIAGCSSSSDIKNSSYTQTARSDQCRLDPSSCMYEGSYEKDEREYAEQRAKELNRASAQKIRGRSSGWW